MGKYCGYCGNKINDNVTCCPYCGAKTKDASPGNTQNNTSFKTIGKLCAVVLIIVAVVLSVVKLLASFQNSPSDSQTENREGMHSSQDGFDSPEEAVAAFMTSFKAQDVDGMLAVFDTEQYLNHVDFADYIERTGGISSYTRIAPIEYGVYRDLMKQQLQGDRALCIQMMAYSVLYPDLDIDFLNQLVVPADQEWAEKLCDCVAPEALGRLELKEYLDPVGKDAREKTVELQNEIFGSEDFAERLVVFQIDGIWYYKGFMLLKYDGRWYVHELRSIFASEDIMKATRIQYENEWESLRREYRFCGFATTEERIKPEERGTYSKMELTSSGFETAEAAAEAFIESFRKHDVEGMMSTLDIDPYLNCLDYANYVDRMGLAYAGAAAGPVEYDFYRELVRYQLISGYSEDIKMLLYNILCPHVEDDFFFRKAIPADRNWAEEFRKEANPDGLKLMENLHWLSGLPFGEKWIAVHSQLYGCDNYAERNIHIDRADVYYGVGLEMAEYNGRWYVHRVTGSFTREPNSNAYWAVKERSEIELEQEALSNLRKMLS